MTEHAPLKYQPSSAALTVACNGWADMSEDVPNVETAATLEGTAVHWVGEQILKSFATPAARLTCTSVDWVGKVAENGVVITPDMFHSASQYATLCLKHAGGYLSEHTFVEKRIKGTRFHAKCWGTLDFAVWKPDQKLLVLRDLKSGHVRVDPKWCVQLIIYAVSLLDEITDGHALDFDGGIEIDMGVISPNVFDGKPVETNWVVEAVDLRGMVNIIRGAFESDGTLFSSGHHCRNCPSLFKCDTAGDNIVSLAAVDARSNLDPMAMTREYEFLKQTVALMKKRLDSITDHIVMGVKEGGSFGMYGMVPSGSPRKKWVSDPRELSGLLGIDFEKKREPITVSQAINKMKDEGVDESVIEGYYTLTPAKMTLEKLDLDGVFGK